MPITNVWILTDSWKLVLNFFYKRANPNGFWDEKYLWVMDRVLNLTQVIRGYLHTTTYRVRCSFFICDVPNCFALFCSFLMNFATQLAFLSCLYWGVCASQRSIRSRVIKRIKTALQTTLQTPATNLAKWQKETHISSIASLLWLPF